MSNSTSIDRRRLLGGAAALLTTAGIVSVGSGVFAQNSTPSPSMDGTPEASPSASPAASPVAGGVAVEVITVDISFEPNTLTIPANTDVVVTVTNNGALQHDFYIDELGVESDLLDGGASTTVTINAAPGTYEYYCSVTGHREAGMVGTLTAE